MPKRHALLICGLLAAALLISTAQAQPTAATREAAVDLVTRDLGGSLDDVRLWIDPTPLRSGQAIDGWHRTIYSAPQDGWLVFVDHHPGANWEHPCSYYFVDRATGQLQRHDAMTPPMKLTELEEITNGRDNPPAGASEAALEAFSQRLRALPKPGKSRGLAKALIISGGANSGNNHIRYWNDCAFIYRTLVEYYGYADENIRVCISDGTNPAADRSDGTNSPTDLDGDGDADTEGPATLAYLDQVFTELAATLTASDQLFIYTTDHGGQESGQDCFLNLWNLEELRDDQLAAYVDALPCETVICTFEQCFSGGMVDDLQGDGRVIATAANWDEYSWAMGPDYIYDTFVYHWTSAVAFARPNGTPVDADTNNDGICSMREAFVYAEMMDNEDETPQYSSTPEILGEALNLFGNLEGVYLAIDQLVIDDTTGGNGNGVVEYGETVEITVTLLNMGASDAPNVVTTLSSTSPYVTVVDGEVSFGLIPGEGTVTATEPLVITVAQDVPDGADLELTLATNETPTSLPLALTAAAPAYAVTVGLIDDLDGGDGDGVAEPGETVLVTLNVANTGSADSPALDLVLHGTLNCVSDEVPRTVGVVATGASVSAAGFQVTVSAGCPEVHSETMTVSLTAAGSYQVDTQTVFTVGPWFDTVEQDMGWTLGQAGDTATTGQWVRAVPLGTYYDSQPVQPAADHTADGTICFVTANGTQGGSAGEADVDGGYTTLVSPVFDVSGAISATLTYWRWYTNDLGNNPNEDYWRVEVTTDGSTWTALENTNLSNNSWAQMTFELGTYVPLTGTVQIRFVADDSGAGSLVEAAVDDIMLSIERTPITGTPQPGTTTTMLRPCSPNPISSAATLSFRLAGDMPTRIELFDLRGRRVKTIHQGTLSQGEHRIGFDAVDDQQRRLPTGIYFVRMHTPERTEVRQMTVVR